ncbi:MAG TPA: lytic transglycosylase domain-containing protein [Terriglobales bacterium]|nr:lytic transglycosylase domain-containing protein [Terriglobales bacterium]
MSGPIGNRRHNRLKTPARTERRWRWQTALRVLLELGSLAGTALLVILFSLGRLADWFSGDSFWTHTVPFAGSILLIALVLGGLARLWLPSRRWLLQRWQWLPAMFAAAIAAGAGWAARQPQFDRELNHLQTMIGGMVEVERIAIAHQVYAAYRRADLADLMVVLERARVYEPTVLEAAAAFDVDAEVLIGVGATESSYHPRRSADGGEGLFQITRPPEAAVRDAIRRLGVKKLDPVNQRHNAFVGAATLKRYLDEMKGDLFLGLLAYNIGPQNGGLRSIMKKYGAKDFVTIQPYLKNLPRDYPIRVLSAALAYRLWKTEGKLRRYEEGDNAIGIQKIGVPGLDLRPKAVAIENAVTSK